MRSPGRSNPRLTLIGLAILVGVWLYYQHEKTGRWSLLPVTLSPPEQEILRIEKQLQAIDKRLKELGRVAKMSGEKYFHSKEAQDLEQEREHLLVNLSRARDKWAKELEEAGKVAP